MSTRLDVSLKKYPEHEEGIRLLVARDPSGNQKYLGWGVQMLAAKQALAPEIADVIGLFHRFNCVTSVRSDIYTYRPQDMAGLREKLFTLKRAADRKRRKREKLYRLDDQIEADIVYDSPDLIVRHIKNKSASVHYGLNTKWCISMLREKYFEEYETHNSMFFFFERKQPQQDEYDKVALMLPRNEEYETAEAFTSLDKRVDIMNLAKVYGSRVFEIFRDIYERSKLYPGSGMFQILSGSATLEQLEGASKYELGRFLEAVCCNDAATLCILENAIRSAHALTSKSSSRLGYINRESERSVVAATVIHPNASPELRERLTKWLRRRGVKIDSICREMRHGRISVSYDASIGGKVIFPRMRRRRFSHRRKMTLSQLRAAAIRLDRQAKMMKKKAKTLQRKLAKKKSRQ